MDLYENLTISLMFDKSIEEIIIQKHALGQFYNIYLNIYKKLRQKGTKTNIILIYFGDIENVNNMSRK